MICPYCAEEIKNEAVVCRYCHRELTAVRFKQLEDKLSERLEKLENQVIALNDRIENLKYGVTAPLKSTNRSVNNRRSFVLSLSIGYIAAIITISIAFLYNSFILLVPPEIIFVGIGIWASRVQQERTITYYLLLALIISILDYLGVMLILLTVIPFSDLITYFPVFKQAHISLLVTPFFLIMLGAFAGEWLESKKPTGRKMNYPTELVNQAVKYTSGKEPKKGDMDKLSTLFTALAPLIAAIGGIIIPLITLIYSRKP